MYYYDDPLAAAWMAKHFLMSFNVPCNAFRGWATEIQLPTDRYYIHPDCVPMLEPQEDDVIQWRSGYVQLYDQTVSRYEFDNAGGKIIQRDGKPFFWPNEMVNCRKEWQEAVTKANGDGADILGIDKLIIDSLDTQHHL